MNQRRHRDFIQNITIALLSVSAVLLFARTQIYNLSADRDWLLSGPEAQSAAPLVPQSELGLSTPVQVVVTGSYGRYGSADLTVADERFDHLRSLLTQALGSARDFAPAEPQAFKQALEDVSVYYDFLVPLPFSVLSELVGVSGSQDAFSVQRLLLARETNGVALYLWEDAKHCLVCQKTSLSPGDLDTAAARYELGNARFAFESPEEHAEDLDPFSLLLQEPPALPVLSASTPLSDTVRLLTALHFNPNTQSRYVESGTEVIMESGRTLRIYTDGTITYQNLAGEESPLSIEAADGIPTPLEAVSEVAPLLHEILSAYADDARLYLESVQQTGSTTLLRFGYQYGGVPIRFTDGKSAAHVTLSGASVTAMTFRVRQYTATETDSLLLPLKQALAIAARESGARFSVGYADNSAVSISAQWLAE